MSGLCGVISFKQQPIEPSILEAMAGAAKYRGPDGITHAIKDNVGFSHLALHITPESFTETLPLRSSDDQLLITADARIDNRQELIDQFSEDFKQEHPSDADLILAAYQRWGVDCCEHLLGDFAFAIWDSRRQHLFTARDVMAMRPLYYRIESDRALFASEIKQILALPDVPAEIFEPAIASYLAGLYEPLSWTFYKGISQLEPGHAMVISADCHRVWAYWKADLDHRITYKKESDYVEHFLELFQEAVRCRIRSVKPIGLFLSGGMDSTSIASMAGHLLTQDSSLCPEFRVYNFAFEELSQCDERFISDHIVKQFQFPATAVLADTAWPLNDYPNHGPDLDTPSIGVYQPLLEKTLAAARQDGVGLMLSGDRGDLVMGEYIYDYPSLLLSGQWLTLLAELKQQSQWREKPLSTMVSWFLLGPLKQSIKDSIRTWPGGNFLDQNWQVKQSSVIHPDWINDEFKHNMNSILSCQEISRKKLQGSFRNHAKIRRLQSIFSPMHMHGMVWSNRINAKFNQGFADPWSDRRIATFALAVPQRILNTTGQEKRLVRQAMEGIMPEAALQEVCKIYPYDLYLQAMGEKARDTVMKLLHDSQIERRRYIKIDYLQQAYQEFLKTQKELNGFWETLTVEMWLRQYWSEGG